MRILATGCVFLRAGACHSPAAGNADTPGSAYDTLIRNGRIVDGTGDAAYGADVLIKDGMIVEIGEIDAESIVVSRGHGTIRWQAGVGTKSGSLSDRDLDRMRAQLREDMEAGAFGMTSGLEYVPGLYSEPAELLALAELVGAYDGIVMSHMRSEDDDRIESSIAELAAQGAHARVHISHLKIVYGKGEARAAELLADIDDIRERGVELSADTYPYTAGYSSVGLLFPEWALPPNDYDEVVEKRRQELAAWVQARMIKRNGPDALLLGSPPYGR